MTFGRDGTVPPGFQDIIMLVHRGFRTPQDQQGAGDLLVQVRLVMDQVNSGSGAVILATGMNDGGAVGSKKLRPLWLNPPALWRK